ncbi:MAG: DoxX family protein [Pseudomonadota bacterium]
MITDTLTPYAALLLRVSLGILALAHGLLKVLVFTVPGTVAFFESLGYPGFMAYAVIAAEILGGIALIAGIQVRLVSLALIPVLVGATITHGGNGWLFSNSNGGWEFPAFWTVTLAVQAMLGGGAWQVPHPTPKFNLGRT